MIDSEDLKCKKCGRGNYQNDFATHGKCPKCGGEVFIATYYRWIK